MESSIGAHLLNSIRGTQIELFYWREGDKEVDFVLKSGDNVTAIEVKSGSEKIDRSGIDLFVKEFKPKRVLVVGDQGISVDSFLGPNYKFYRLDSRTRVRLDVLEFYLNFTLKPGIQTTRQVSFLSNFSNL